MRHRIISGLYIAALLLLSNAQVLAQGSTSSNNYLVYGFVAIIAILILGLVVQVSDNLLAIEAKQMGVDKSGANFSIFPRLNEIFTPNAPEYAADAPVKTLKKGLDILLQGEAPLVIDSNIQANTFAVQPGNFLGMSPIPKLEVEVGKNVLAGDVLFYDKKRPEIKYVAPVSGEIIAVNRGDKRAIKEVVILADKTIKYREIPAFNLETETREALVNFLLDTGAWSLLVQRPFDVVPEPTDIPRDIFITTFDTAPLAPNLSFVVQGREVAFQRGLDLLRKLTPGKVYLGLDARGKEAPATAFTEAQGVEKTWFRGKHPAGNVGVQIHHTAPIKPGDRVWALNVQDVITLGALLTERRFNAERVIALTGVELKKPTYVRTYIGANIADLVKDNLVKDHVRFISGDVLSGKQKAADSFLNFHDDQLTVVEEGDYYEMFGWLIPKFTPTGSKAFPNALFPDIRFKADTNTHGEERAFVMSGQYEAVLPMDIYPMHLMKAILANDFERMEGLGIYELSEEDVALCEFVCTSKQPIQEILREGLNTMYEQS
ncbi:MAG: Na(+)-translocating NADH-quinone reductase subunit A [Saprospiraceae bacterium]